MPNNKFKKYIGKFPRCKVAVLGDVMLDSVIWGNVERISPEAPVPVVHAQREKFIPGGASNVANNVVSLGSKAAILGLVGNDANKDILSKELRKRRISDRHLIVDRKRPTIRKTRVMAIPQHQLLRIDREEIKPVNPSIGREIIKKAKQLISRNDVLVISDYAKGTLTLEIAREVISFAKDKKKPIIIDPKPVNKDYYRGATVLTPNRKEALEMSENDDDVLEAGKNLAQELGVSIVLTRSEEGMSILEKDKKIFNIKTKAQEVFDVSGAGDTVVAGIALSLAAGANLVDSAQIANYAAGVVVGKVGTATLTREELLKAI